MTRRKYAPTTADPKAEEALDQFFGSGDSDDRVDFGDIDWLAFGRLAAALTGRGALVTLYIASADNVLCISVGAGERRKRYQCDTTEQFDQLVEGLYRKLGGPVLLPKK